MTKEELLSLSKYELDKIFMQLFENEENKEYIECNECTGCTECTCKALCNSDYQCE